MTIEMWRDVERVKVNSCLKSSFVLSADRGTVDFCIAIRFPLVKWYIPCGSCASVYTELYFP